MDAADFYKRQISLTEWLEAIEHKDLQALRQEDNVKRERLRQLNDIIGLPYDRPYQFEAADIAARGPEFEAFLRDHGQELCVIRIMPHEPTLPKLRLRGDTIAKAVDWFHEQDIDASKYRVDIGPHADEFGWATIFVVNDHGISGEIIKGEPLKLTQGHYGEGERPIRFHFDFKTWQLDPFHAEAQSYLANLVQRLHVNDPAVRDQLAGELESTFANNYLRGYFETTDSPGSGIWFCDYNRLLGEMYKGYVPSSAISTPSALVRGMAGSPGRATGRVRVIDGPQAPQLQPGEILVCTMTTPDYLPLMQQAAAIVTDRGGILSHAAIVARELGKPCLTATGNATSILTSGQTVIVDADAGVVLPG